jgi:predicted RNase H-like HicB family nuclease
MKHLHAVIWKEDALFVAKALEVEIASQGATEAEALVNLREALELFFEDQPSFEIISVTQPKIQPLAIDSHA